jgi:hypothetical protein
VAGKAAALVSPHSDDEHIEAISELLDDSAARGRLTVAGVEHARGFTWENSARKLHGYFSEML